MYEGVANSFRNHPKLKEPETSFIYLIHKTSLKSYYAKLHIPPTFDWLSTARNYTIGRKSVILRLKEYYEIVGKLRPLSAFFPKQADFFTEMHF